MNLKQKQKEFLIDSVLNGLSAGIFIFAVTLGVGLAVGVVYAVLSIF